MSKKKAKKKVEHVVKIDDLYTAFKAAYEALRDGRFKLYLQAKEHFLAKEYEEAAAIFKKLKENVHEHTQETRTPAEAVRELEYLAEHMLPPRHTRGRKELTRQHLRYMKNRILDIESVIY